MISKNNPLDKVLEPNVIFADGWLLDASDFITEKRK